ncbi:bifunctional phosphopantothenoylcysteine decarboxylase/phosphopantothenate--cysteine ligase CoaBC [Phaeovulum vinaykumarii]|nr:bifunctional phosphopantothenoylcysteine decarboxylase/phosphopantothenate--cysteine ligase CoaBC [Phaeovulum vinaykumarii]SOC00202.1 phosphopantothenate-cysteine ligase /phosphopantothenoylcysteine decarboxylase [Phaeovulum vinaykumarii]
MLAGKKILLVICGGIAAYKTLELIRRLREAGASVTPVMTRAAAQFVTPLSVTALAGTPCRQELFDLGDEAEMGHIQLSRAADLVVVAPATADFMARMAHGHADDLPSTLMLATDKPVLIAPAMNVRMWGHPATRRNLACLRGDGIMVVGPDEGAMACGEYGPGRMAEPAAILAAIAAALGPKPLSGRHVIVTSGPTHEPIDPVRYIANRSSGAQGTAIAAALVDLGASVSFVTGPASVPPPPGVRVLPVETAAQMRAAVMEALPADAAVMAAAVADWRVENAAAQKMKKDGSGRAPALSFAQNPDILAEVAGLGADRPRLVVGFAAETEKVEEHARDKRARKGCDWIVANDVSPATGIMGGAENAVIVIDADGAETWPRLPKDEVARRLAQRIARALAWKEDA